MAAGDILLGRGILSLGGADVGQCSSLAIRHRVEMVPIAHWDALAGTIGGVAEIARRTRVFIDFTLHELTASNRAALMDLAGDPDSIALSWSGKNAMAADCSASSWSLSVSSFVVTSPALVPLIARTLDGASISVSGEALRASGSSVWYTLSGS